MSDQRRRAIAIDTLAQMVDAEAFSIRPIVMLDLFFGDRPQYDAIHARQLAAEAKATQILDALDLLRSDRAATQAA